MWTNDEMNQYAVYLDRQEQLVLSAVALGYNVNQAMSLVIAELGDFADKDFVESVYTVATHPDRKVALQD